MAGVKAEQKRGTSQQALIADETSDFEIRFFQRILRRSPEHVDALRRLVELQAGRGEHYAAIVLSQRLTRLKPNDAIVHYNLACMLAMIGRKKIAIQALQRAIRLGYSDISHMRTDPDLEPLHDETAFRQMLQRSIP